MLSIREHRPHYALVCPVCAWRGSDDGLCLQCPFGHEPALLQAEYATTTFRPRTNEEGLFRYRDWLPIRRTLPGAGRTVVYRSGGLGRFLGLPRLWIAFNGYWPEQDCHLETGTFKELEALSVLGRLPDDPRALVVSSAGNTAAAFALHASRHRIPCVIVVPERSLSRLNCREPLAGCVRLVALADADYSDAIAFAETLAVQLDGVLEGGTKNVARRAGLATVLLSAMEVMPALPQVYVQAVGSGAGAIAVHEAALRLVADGSGDVPPRLVLCQQLPVAPLYQAWQRDQPSMRVASPPRHVDSAEFADVLTNRHPPYAVRGGVRDCLAQSSGQVIALDDRAARAAQQVFSELEGIDIEPAAAVAVAGLRAAVAAGEVSAGETVLLNITGGGRRRLGAPSGDAVAAAITVTRADQIAGTPPVELLRTCATLH